MSHDTVADMLTKIRNASLVKHQIVQLPLTNLTKEIAKVLLSEGFIVSFEELKNGANSSLLLVLKYTGKDRIPKITNIQRVSRPGLRVYNNAKKMPRVLGGFGTAVISTSKGLVTDQFARRENIGGEVLCFIW